MSGAPERTTTARLYAEWQEGAEYAVLKPMGVVTIPRLNRPIDVLVHRGILFVLAFDGEEPIYRQAFYLVDPASHRPDLRGEIAVI